MNLRFAVQEDIPALLDIYANYIPTTVTFEYELPSQQEFSRRMSAFSAVYPYLAAEDGTKVMGYAYAHRYAERAAYGWGAEMSIYLHPDAAGQGLGKRMYQAVLELLRLQGVRTAYGLVTSPNPASEGLHRSLGFRLVGVDRNAGYKNGRWIDLLRFEKTVGSYDPDPAPVLPVGELPPAQIQEVLRAALKGDGSRAQRG